MRDFSWAVRADEEEGSAMTSSDLGVALGESVLKRLVDRVGWKRSSRVLFLAAALEPIASLLAMAWRTRNGLLRSSYAALRIGAKARLGLAGKLQKPEMAKVIPFRLNLSSF